ncbi:hydrolase [Streptomyces sp. NPDC050560]|uniref:hydrolase n=1 Tax=Streptomyces sp. NPDC050560 TaxID=3365630 RepID=UPI00378A4BA6
MASRRTARTGRRAPAVLTAALALTAAAAAGLTAQPAAAGAGSTAADCTAAGGFCEDFESQTGTTPSGRWNTDVRDCSGTGAATVDSTEAHSGTTSIRVDGKTGYCNHAFVGTDITDVPVSASLYVRFWIKHSTALPAGHVAFAAMHDPNDNDRDLRMGGQNGALQWNRESDDATLPAQSPVGVSKSIPLPTGTWSCVEYQIDESAGQLATWVDGTEVEGLVADGTPTPDVDQQWLARGGWSPAPTDLRLGWESYADGDDTLWFDDVAVGTAPLGCD